MLAASFIGRRLAAAVVLTLTAARAQDPSAEPATYLEDGRGWRYTRLDLQVECKPDSKVIVVSGKGELQLERDAPSLGPTLGINSAAPVLEFTMFETSNTDALVNLARRMDVLPNVRLADVRFADPMPRGSRVQFEFVCTGISTNAQFDIGPDGALASWTQAWYPTPYPDEDQAQSNAMAAAGTTTFHLSAGWRAVTNGVPGERRETAGRVEDQWIVDEPVARSFAAGPYESASHSADGRAIEIFRLRPPASQPSTAAAPSVEHAAALTGALRAMEARFGPYPYARYSIAEVPEGVGDFYASSEQGFIMCKPGVFEAEGGNLPLFAHEMAHGWWGNLVGSRGRASTLVDEALAQYSAVVAIEGVEGLPAAIEFLHYSRPGYVMVQSARGYFQMWREGRDKPLIAVKPGGWDHHLSDAKGHWVYHMLRRRIGDERFFSAMRGLIDTYRGKAMSLDDLRAAFVAAAPDVDVAGFFTQWLERPGAPVLDVDWHATDDPPGAKITIRQAQGGTPFTLPLTIELQTRLGVERHAVELREVETALTLSATGARVRELRLDPDREVLMWRPEYGPRPPLLP